MSDGSFGSQGLVQSACWNQRQPRRRSIKKRRASQARTSCRLARAAASAAGDAQTRPPSRPAAESFSRELFAGCSALPSALWKAGVRVGRPCRCYVNGQYDRRYDLTRFDVVETLLRDVLSGLIFYLHFGTPCSSWGPAGRLNLGTRSKTRPEGDGSLPRGAVGNHRADQTAKLCQALVKVNGYFSIENPAGSYLFLYSPITDLGRATSCYPVRFCQCAYGLRFPGGKKNEFC